jgi:tRNA pseudouridine32 synthase/23S rRNA pseudouridine746 synthase
MSHERFIYRPPEGDIELLHVDANLIVVNKPSGLLSVPGRGDDRQDCLIHRVQRQFPDVLSVHRLDMSTSGVMLLARGAEMQSHLSWLFMNRKVDKRYLAVVDGLLEKDSGEIDLPLICDWPNRPKQKVDFEIGKKSLTRFRVIARDAEVNISRVELEPLTGRSHQLRVHLASLGHPILGDEFYAGAAEDKADRLLLHAMDLSFPDPSTGEIIHFHSPPPF